MFDFLRRSSPPAGPPNYAFLGVDFHAHWLPGIDDGAPDMETSLVMLRTFEELGFTRLVASPHIMVDYYRNTPSIIEQKLGEVRQAAAAAGIGLQLGAAAEYMLDEGFEHHLNTLGLLTFGNRQVLVEFGFYTLPVNLDHLLFQLQTAGYRPVIAHPERYAYWHGKLDRWVALHSKGLSLQVNLLSLIGYYGSSVRAAAFELIERGLVSYLGSDAHTVEHLLKAKKVLEDRKVRKVLHDTTFRNERMTEAT